MSDAFFGLLLLSLRASNQSADSLVRAAEHGKLQKIRHILDTGKAHIDTQDEEVSGEGREHTVTIIHS